MTYTREDIVRIVQEEDVKFIRMQFVDIFGQLKNVAITAGQLEKALDNRIMIDGSSIEGFVRVNESDQYLRPDLGSFAIYPWRPSHGRWPGCSAMCTIRTAHLLSATPGWYCAR